MQAAMKGHNSLLFRYTLIFVFEGLIIGVNITNVSGVISILQEQWEISDTTLGFIIGVLLFGCYIGGMITLKLDKRINKKHIALLSATLLIISPLGCALSTNISTMLVFRFLIGIGFGMIWEITPAYISDFFSFRIKNALLSYRHLAIALGILIAYIADYLLLEHSHNWRFMLGFTALFSIMYFLLLLLTLVPQSEQVFMNDVAMSKQENNRSVMEIFPTILPQLSFLLVFFIYTPIILEMTGSKYDTALILSEFIGIIYLLATLLSTCLYPTRYNRQRLIWGNIGMILSIFYLSYTFAISSISGMGLVIAIICYIICCVISFSFYVAKNNLIYFLFIVTNIFTPIIVLLFPWLLNKLGGSITFGILAGFNILTFSLMLFYIFRVKNTVDLKQI